MIDIWSGLGYQIYLFADGIEWAKCCMKTVQKWIKQAVKEQNSIALSADQKEYTIRNIIYH